jgi:hypothetical protein
MITRATPDMQELGMWLVEKWAQRLAETGRDYFGVARQMRKQGFPLEVALALLLRRGCP